MTWRPRTASRRALRCYLVRSRDANSATRSLPGKASPTSVLSAHWDRASPTVIVYVGGHLSVK